MSTTTDADLDMMAGELWRRLQSAQAGPPVIADLPDVDVAGAYRIQRTGVALRCEESGARIVGHKIGATNPVIQRLFGVDTPDFGHLVDDMVLADGVVIDIDRLIAPRVEIEVAFVLGAPIHGPCATVTDVLVATAALVPAFEIIDSRITDWNITFQDTIADNGSSALVVLGDSITEPTAIDLRTLGAVLELDGVVTDTGAGAASLGHPARAVAWLANALAGFGQHLEAGHVVLSGALTTAPVVHAGTTVTGHLAQLGSIRCSFGSGR